LQNAEQAAEIKKKRTFRKFSYRGIDLDAYVPLPPLAAAQLHEFSRKRRMRNGGKSCWDVGDGLRY